MVYAVILAGGKGERFWPLSRTAMPKQFLRLTSEKSMLEETIDRVHPLVAREQVRVVTGESMGALMREMVPYLGGKQILAEPVGRNTCIAIGLAAVHIRAEDPSGVMVVLSADHLIRPAERLRQIISTAVGIASSTDKLLTIGVVPTRPETGYGYIRLGETFGDDNDVVVHEVAAFVEKPKQAVAHEYFYSGNYLWNSGMFVWSVGSILAALQRHEPEMARLLDKYSTAIGTPSELEARTRLYGEVKSISIDYAILEKASNVLTVRGDMVWDDVGGWNALERYKDRDSDNNVIVGEVVAHETYETTIYNAGKGVIACLGLSDLVVVQTGEITFVAHKTKIDEIKALLARIGEHESTRHHL